MRAWLSLWNVVGAFVFLLGSVVYVRSGEEASPKPLPLPASLEAQAPRKVVVHLHLPKPPEGFVPKAEELTLALGEDPYQKALEVWLQRTQTPLSLKVFRTPEGFVVDLLDPPRSLDIEGEVYLIYGLAYTLLNSFPEGKEVRFLVDGAPSLGFGHLDLSKPIRP
ncbi:MAG: GerMN domain-containing protein [Thermaceae bacterium]